MKPIAFYLPQYHEIPENSLWWGKGYTEWVSVRNAKPLYFGHYQPTEPLNNNYYDLMDDAALRWQVKIAKEYGIYGFCFYHYWFGEKMLLEKPAEKFLQDKSLDLHFCFSWANESWKRTWGNVDGNGWNDIYDSVMQNKQNGMLMEQKYGNRENWIKHFMYLLPFFQDDRYIKIDNKPVFLLYKAKQIKCLFSMLKEWNSLAKKYGFDGLYIISTNDCEIQNQYINANVLYEPTNSFWNNKRMQKRFIVSVARKKREKGKKFPWLYSYSSTWKYILKQKVNNERKTYLGGFVGFDKTPREGKNALIFLGGSPKKFKKYFRKLVQKSRELGNEFVFINAWNEWGEGCYLEPDKKHGWKYLEAVRDSIK